MARWRLAIQKSSTHIVEFHDASVIDPVVSFLYPMRDGMFRVPYPDRKKGPVPNRPRMKVVVVREYKRINATLGNSPAKPCLVLSLLSHILVLVHPYPAAGGWPIIVRPILHHELESGIVLVEPDHAGAVLNIIPGGPWSMPITAKPGALSDSAS
jgi:hypothetical protein